MASAAGLARLAPNGLLKQNESVDVACLKPSLVRVLKTIEGHYGRKMIGHLRLPQTRPATAAPTAPRIRCTCIAPPPTSRFPASANGIWRTISATMPGRGGVGTYCHTESVHVDVGPERDWNWRCRRRG